MSCPPFSVAGKQIGHAEKRNLSPDTLRVISDQAKTARGTGRSSPGVSRGGRTDPTRFAPQIVSSA
ncbi:hypothetical protein [Sagittula stellata]|uniref:hypothetical protein n=1 Tax=Sagittula stellata TaxID=52603 RepID=UPI003218F3EC